MQGHGLEVLPVHRWRSRGEMLRPYATSPSQAQSTPNCNFPATPQPQRLPHLLTLVTGEPLVCPSSTTPSSTPVVCATLELPPRPSCRLGCHPICGSTLMCYNTPHCTSHYLGGRRTYHLDQAMCTDAETGLFGYGSTCLARLRQWLMLSFYGSCYPSAFHLCLLLPGVPCGPVLLCGSGAPDL